MSSTTHVTTLMLANDEQLYRFPPFPAPPEGVTIVPFSMFVPAGYRCVTDPSGDLIEVDAWVGIPTVRVLNEEEAARKRKANRKRRNAGKAMDTEGRLIPWWEEWEEGEALRATSDVSFDRCVPLFFLDIISHQSCFLCGNGLLMISIVLDSHTSFEDRVCVAADDFRLGRTWPEIAQGVRLMWDQVSMLIVIWPSIDVVYSSVSTSDCYQAFRYTKGSKIAEEAKLTVPTMVTKHPTWKTTCREQNKPGSSSSRIILNKMPFLENSCNRVQTGRR